jgi:amidase
VLLLIDDPEIYDGACVGVQMVGRRLEEEKMLILTEYVGNALGGSDPHSVP